MAKKQKVNENITSTVETTEIRAFTSLPMKWREVCSKYALQLNYTHAEIVKMSFIIGKFDRAVHGIATPEQI